MNILLINPPYHRIEGIAMRYFPIGLGYIAAVLKGLDHKVWIYNAEQDRDEKESIDIFNNSIRIQRQQTYIKNLKDEAHYVWLELREVMKELRPHVVGISVMSSTCPSALCIARICKEEFGCTIIAGGIHATIRPKELLQTGWIDYVVIGEGENTIKELIYALNNHLGNVSNIKGIGYKIEGRIVINEPRELEADINNFPIPDRSSLLFPRIYKGGELGCMITMRGCPFNCTYCSSRSIWKNKARYRSMDAIMEEIQKIRFFHNVNSLLISDDTFTINRNHVMNFCKRMLDERLDMSWSCFTRIDCIDREMIRLMKQSGLSGLGIGVESGSDRILERIKKGYNRSQILKTIEILKDEKVNFSMNIMIGFPFETIEDAEETISLVKEAEVLVNINTFTPYPETIIYKECESKGWIEKEIDWLTTSQHSPFNYFAYQMGEDNYKKQLKKLCTVCDEINKRVMEAMKSKGIENRLTCYYSLLNAWLRKRNLGKRLAEVLNHRSIVVYGAGEIGKRLIEELKDSKVKVCAIVDKNPNLRGNNYLGIKVINLKDLTNDSNFDTVVVTVAYDYEEIKKEISEVLKGKEILNLAELVSKM